MKFLLILLSFSLVWAQSPDSTQVAIDSTAVAADSVKVLNTKKIIEKEYKSPFHEFIDCDETICRPITMDDLQTKGFRDQIFNMFVMTTCRETMKQVGGLKRCIDSLKENEALYETVLRIYHAGHFQKSWLMVDPGADGYAQYDNRTLGFILDDLSKDYHMNNKCLFFDNRADLKSAIHNTELVKICYEDLGRYIETVTMISTEYKTIYVLPFVEDRTNKVPTYIKIKDKHFVVDPNKGIQIQNPKDYKDGQSKLAPPMTVMEVLKFYEFSDVENFIFEEKEIAEGKKSYKEKYKLFLNSQEAGHVELIWQGEDLTYPSKATIVENYVTIASSVDVVPSDLNILEIKYSKEKSIYLRENKDFPNRIDYKGVGFEDFNAKDYIIKASE